MDAEQSDALILQRLPDDILQDIVEHLYGAGCGSTYHVIFSHVCRKFRQIALDMPTLWSIIDSHMTEDTAELYLKRSKAADLTIRLANLRHRRDVVAKLDRFLNLVSQESSRWAHFEFNPIDIPFWRETLTVVLKHVENKPVPRLKHLAVHLPQQYSWLFADSDVPNALLQFYSTWTTPRLDRLEMSNSIPNSHMGTTLVSCNLHLASTIDFIHEWNINDLHSFLSSCHMLQELRLRLESLAASPTPLDVIHLNALQSYAVFVLSDRLSNSFLQLTSVLHMPNLSRWSVKIKLDEGTQCTFANGLFDTPNDFRALREFNLSVYCSLPGVLPVHLLFGRLRHLHHLTLKVTQAEFPPAFEAPESGIAPLRSLVLSNCRRMSADLFKDVVIALKRQKDWSEFEKLTVHRCRQITEEDIRAAVPENVTVYH